MGEIEVGVQAFGRSGVPVSLLSVEERRRMLEEIGRVAIAIGREMAGAPLEAESGPTPGALLGRERLAFLAAEQPAIRRAMNQIAAQSRITLRTEVIESPPDRCRNPLPKSISQATRRGALLPNTPSLQHSNTPTWLATRLGGRLPRTLAEAVRVPTTDSLENRYVAALLASWRHDLRSIAALAEWQQDAACRDQALDIESALGGLAGSAFLLECSPTVQGSPTEALLRDGRYRRLYEIGRRYRRLLRYAWDAPALTLPPREEWQLYEMWCFFRVAAALRAMGLRARSGDAVVLIHGRWTIALAKGQASRLVFEGHAGRISLFYNRTFPSAAAGSSEAASRTHTMIPDICLEQEGRFLIFDPKFRSYDLPGSEQDDIVKMHAYTDAIVRKGKPVVEDAWCLFAGLANGQRDVIAYPACTPESPFGEAGIGAIRLRPGVEEDRLKQLISNWNSTVGTRQRVRT